MWENNNRQYVYLRWSYTAQRKSNHTKGFSWLLRRVQPIFPNPCQDLWFHCILFSSPYEEWSNQAWKRVSSVCWRVKRDFQNNPLSRWGFFMYCFFYCKIVCFKIAKEVTIIVEILASRIAGPFSGTMHNYCIACPHMWCSCVIIQPLDRSYFVKWNAELLHTRHRSWSDTCK